MGLPSSEPAFLVSDFLCEVELLSHCLFIVFFVQGVQGSPSQLLYLDGDNGLSPICKAEGRLFCGLVRHRSICPEYIGEFFYPDTLSLVQTSLYAMQDDSVGSLGLTIGLGVFDRGKMILDAEVLHELSEPLICKLGPIVSDDDLGDTKSGHNILLEEYDVGICSDGC